MTAAYRDLYQDMILDHGRRPRNVRAIEGAAHVEGYNPICGDRLKVYVKVEDGAICDVSFEGEGCAISMASASMMTAALRGKSVDDAMQTFRRFRQIVVGQEPDGESMGKLVVFEGVREFPSRVKCAMLAWHAFRGAVEGGSQSVTTE